MRVPPAACAIECAVVGSAEFMITLLQKARTSGKHRRGNGPFLDLCKSVYGENNEVAKQRKRRVGVC